MIDANPNLGIKVIPTKVHRDIQEILDKLNRYGDHLTTLQLIDIGLYSNMQVAQRERSSGVFKDYIRISRVYLYPKIAVEKYIYLNHDSILKNIKLRRLRRKNNGPTINKSEYNKVKRHLIDIIMNALNDCNL